MLQRISIKREKAIYFHTAGDLKQIVQVKNNIEIIEKIPTVVQLLLSITDLMAEFYDVKNSVHEVQSILQVCQNGLISQNSIQQCNRSKFKSYLVLTQVNQIIISNESNIQCFDNLAPNFERCIEHIEMIISKFDEEQDRLFLFLLDQKNFQILEWLMELSLQLWQGQVNKFMENLNGKLFVYLSHQILDLFKRHNLNITIFNFFSQNVESYCKILSLRQNSILYQGVLFILYQLCQKDILSIEESMKVVSCCFQQECFEGEFIPYLCFLTRTIFQNNSDVDVSDKLNSIAIYIMDKLRSSDGFENYEDAMIDLCYIIYNRYLEYSKETQIYGDLKFTNIIINLLLRSQNNTLTKFVLSILIMRISDAQKQFLKDVEILSTVPSILQRIIDQILKRLILIIYGDDKQIGNDYRLKALIIFKRIIEYFFQKYRTIVEPYFEYMMGISQTEISEQVLKYQYETLNSLIISDLSSDTIYNFPKNNDLIYSTMDPELINQSCIFIFLVHSLLEQKLKEEYIQYLKSVTLQVILDKASLEINEINQLRIEFDKENIIF